MHEWMENKKSRISKVKNCIQPLIYMDCIDIHVMIECSSDEIRPQWIGFDWIGLYDVLI